MRNGLIEKPAAVASSTLDAVAPVASVTTPATATSAAVVALSEAVSGVSADDAVACTAATVRLVRLLPRAALSRGVGYTVGANPSTVLGRVVDKAGNAVPATSATFTL